MALLKKFRAFGIVSVFLLSFFFVIPTSFAYTYDGQNPTSTGCANDATTMRSDNLTDPNQPPNGIPGGTIELRYSIACHTAWARMTFNSNWQNTYSGNTNKATIHRNYDGREYSCTVPIGSNSCYTAMVYDKDPLTSYAKGYYNYYYSMASHWFHFSGKTSNY